jgi:hypothetical protein
MRQKVVGMDDAVSVMKAFHEISSAFNKAEQDANGAVDEKLEELSNDLDNFLQFAREDAIRLLNDSGTEMAGTVRPSFMLVSKCGMVCPMLMPGMPEDDAERALLASCMSAVFQTAPVDAYMFMSEVWVAEVTPATDAAIANLAPSKRKDRRECVFIRVANRTKTKIGIYEILRGGDKVNLSEESSAPSDSYSEAPNVLMSDLFAISKRLKKVVNDLSSGENSSHKPFGCADRHN